MRRRVFCGVMLLMVSAAVGVAAAQDRPPNIVVILADDFGVGDIQAHYPDNKIATPYLDRLVRQGMSFTDAHSPSAVCSPTRYGLLTGRYAYGQPFEPRRIRLPRWTVETGVCHERQRSATFARQTHDRSAV